MTLFTRLTQMPLMAHGAATAVTFGAFLAVKNKLDALYAASRHPVDYATGQTTFDAERIKGFYAHIQQLETLDVYIQTQQFDFLFILCVAALGLTLGTLVARMSAPGTWGRRLGFAAAGLALAGATMDALENLTSFVMLADPQGFALWLALPYSGFAAIKFALLALAMLEVVLSAVAGGLSRLVALVKPASRR